jgi:hypothetical protein
MKKKLLLLGYNTHKQHSDPLEYSEHAEGGEYWALFFKDAQVDEYYVVNVCSTYGSCYSGYCGASWGYINQIERVSKLPEIAFKAVKPIYIELTEADVLNVQFSETEYHYDASVETLVSTDGEIIATSTGDGGCQWYSSGSAFINLELFT